MKNIYSLFLLFGILGSNYSFADCMTGYACSLEGLQAQNKQLEELYINELNGYRNENSEENFIIPDLKQDPQYENFFPYSLILHNTVRTEGFNFRN